MDPADPAIGDFLLEQAQRHLETAARHRRDGHRPHGPDPASTTRAANNGMTWITASGPGTVLLVAAVDVEAGRDDARRRQGIIVNNHTKRLDLMRIPTDLCEFGYAGVSLNVSALMSVRKPLMLWTDGPIALEREPDAYFQRHLSVGGYPTAPYPGNNHCIKPGNARAEK